MRKLPDKVYLIMETAIDEILEEMKSEEMRGPIHRIIAREFYRMMMESFPDFMDKKMKEKKDGN